MPINRRQARMTDTAPRLPLAECDGRQQRPGNLRPFHYSRPTAPGREYAFGILTESSRTTPIKKRSVRPTLPLLDFGLLRDLQCVIHFNPKIPNGAFQLAMAEQKLDGS